MNKNIRVQRPEPTNGADEWWGSALVLRVSLLRNFLKLTQNINRFGDFFAFGLDEVEQLGRCARTPKPPIRTTARCAIPRHC